MYPSYLPFSQVIHILFQINQIRLVYRTYLAHHLRVKYQYHLPLLQIEHHTNVFPCELPHHLFLPPLTLFILSASFILFNSRRPSLRSCLISLCSSTNPFKNITVYNEKPTNITTINIE